MRKTRRLLDEYHFPGFRPKAATKGIFGEPRFSVIQLERRQKKRSADVVARSFTAFTIRKSVWSGIYPEEMPVNDDSGRCQRSASGLEDGQGNGHVVYGRAVAAGEESPAGNHRYRRDSDLKKSRTSDRDQRSCSRLLLIWFGGKDRSEESTDRFYHWLGPKRSGNIWLAVIDMWKAFEKSTRKNAPAAAILYDKFHVMRHLREALDKVRKQEYARLSGEDRKYIKGQKWVLLSNRENLTLGGKGERRAFAVTELGQEWVMERKLPPRLQPGFQTIVVFDIPERYKEARVKLRKYLRSLQFMQLQKSVWISDLDWGEGLVERFKEAHVEEWVSIYQGQKIF